MEHLNRYYDTDYVSHQVKAGEHRQTIGGMWDKIGQMQFDYLRAQGLQPGSTLLDIGCGCLRGGVHYAAYLDAGNYYGIDLSRDLLDSGYDIELAAAGLQHKVPRENLRDTDAFDIAPFGVRFDMAIAVSVFSHLPASYLRQCLINLADSMKTGGTLYATYFHCPPGHDFNTPLRHPAGKLSHPGKDPFHYREEELVGAAEDLPWRLETYRSWEHPRDQWMAHFVKIDQ